MSWRHVVAALAISVGLGWMGAALLPVANLLTPTGIIAAERTLFLPSVGLVLVAGALVELWAVDRGALARRAAGAAAVALLALGVWRSATRAPVWTDSRTLYAQTILDAPRSYWAWRNYAGDLVLQGRPDDARAAYARSLSLFDRDPTVYDDFAGLERREGRCDRSLPLLDQALHLDPERPQTAARLIGCLVTLGAFDSARGVARRQVAGGHEEFRSLLGLVDSAAQARHLDAPPARQPR